MKADDLRATLLSLKAYVEEAEEKLRVVRLEMAALLLEMEEDAGSCYMEDEGEERYQRAIAKAEKG